MEECDVRRTDPPSDIGLDLKFRVDVAVQHYTQIIDVVDHLCLGKAEPST